jgi:hypothetical protein
MVLGLGLYLVRKLAWGLLLLLGVSCSDSSESPPMVPTTSLEIQKAQEEILAKISPLKIQKNEFVYFIKSQEVYTGQQDPSVSLMEEESITVTDRLDFPDYIEVTVQRDVIDHLVDGSPHSKFKDVYYFANDPAALARSLSAKASEDDIRFYNLKVSSEKIKKPQKVIDKEPCTTPDECLLQVQKISYDIVFLDPQNPQTTKVEVWLSSEVPYFATILQSCYTTVVSVETSRPLVRQCKTVFDYQFD